MYPFYFASGNSELGRKDNLSLPALALTEGNVRVSQLLAKTFLGDLNSDSYLSIRKNISSLDSGIKIH